MAASSQDFTVDGRWTMKTLTARTKREAKLELVQLQANAPLRVARGGGSPCDGYYRLVRCGGVPAPLRGAGGVGRAERAHTRPLPLGHCAATSCPPGASGRSGVSALTRSSCSTSVCARRAVGRRSCGRSRRRRAGFFSFSVRRGYIESNPVSKLERGERAKVNSDDRRVLSNDEVARLLAAAETPFRAGVARRSSQCRLAARGSARSPLAGHRLRAGSDSAATTAPTASRWHAGNARAIEDALDP